MKNGYVRYDNGTNPQLRVLTKPVGPTTDAKMTNAFSVALTFAKKLLK